MAYETNTNCSSDMCMSIPKEILIKTFELGNDQAVSEERNSTVSHHHTMNPRRYPTPMGWEQQTDFNKLQGDQSRFEKLSGCTVSLSSSDCSSHVTSSMPIDPLDYRKDWTVNIDNDITMCIPELLLVQEEKEWSDNNSLCSYLSEDYEMDSEENMTGLWDGEQHDISIPDWVLAQKEI